MLNVKHITTFTITAICTLGCICFMAANFNPVNWNAITWLSATFFPVSMGCLMCYVQRIDEMLENMQ